MMKILRLRNYCSPECVAPTAMGDDIDKAFAENGITSINYTPVPSRGISDELRNKYKKIKYEELSDGQVIIHRFPMIKEGTTIVQRALKYLFCTIVEYFKGINAKDIDVVYCGSTPPTQGMLCAMVARRLSRKYGRKVPFVYNLQDIFPDSLVGTGLTHKGSIIWKIGRWIEDYTYRHADKIIVISEGFKQNIMAKGVPEEKIEVIYNWVDQNAVFDVPRENNKLFEKYKLDHCKFYLTYCGNIGLTQNMDMLLEVMKELKADYPEIHLVLIGEGVYKKQVETIIERDKLTNVTLLPFQPYEDISHVFSLGDVGLVISKPEVGANSVPSKTWSIMSASRPVLANFDENELKNILETGAIEPLLKEIPLRRMGGCGIFTKAGDKEAFKNAILKLHENRDLRDELGRNGRKLIQNYLTKELGTRKYVDVLRRVSQLKYSPIGGRGALFICPTSGNGGIQSWGRKMLTSFPDGEYQLRHVDVSYRRSTMHHEQGIRRKIDGLLDLLQVYKDVRKTIRENNIALMHTTTSGNIGTLRDYILCRKCHRHHIPCIMHCRYGCISEDFAKQGFWGNLLRKTMHLYDQIWVLDKRSEATLKKNTLLREKVHLTPNSIQVPDSCDLTPKEYKTIAFVGNLIPSKGFFELIYAIVDYNLDVKLTLIGPYSEDSVVKIKNIAGERYGSKIVCTGKLSNTETLDMIKKMDMVALPSYYASEAFPISILEAMSLGKLVIATRRAAIADMLTDIDGNECGYFVKEKSVEDIAEAIKWCQTHPDEADKRCAKAYEKVKICYNTNVVYRLYRSLYNKVITS